jgi:hypothetical protein
MLLQLLFLQELMRGGWCGRRRRLLLVVLRRGSLLLSELRELLTHFTELLTELLILSLRSIILLRQLGQ